ncbi:MAG: Uma2 family endonuclease [Roseiflexus sp.]|nr:Uma2 family endonuclease [Roseiflexus sp.]MCS7289766.1 Uma2 family endonuclease [Roseiflexus sp.]MDW8145752.1 Uma2 family endonuclease [Roseiflexaceae bacterium]
MSAPTAVDPSAATQHPAPLRMTYAEWLAWDHAGLSEWVNGEVIIHMPTTEEHQRVVDFLSQLLGLFVRAPRLGIVRGAPFAMRALPDGPGREPDLFFLAEEHKERLTRHELAGPADLVIEVISDDSVALDRDEKFYEYQAAGVREYWIIDPRPGRLRADFYVLDARGRYRAVPPDDNNIYRSTVLPGFWLDVEWLWRPDPNPLAALGRIVGTEQVMSAVQDEV